MCTSISLKKPKLHMWDELLLEDKDTLITPASLTLSLNEVCDGLLNGTFTIGNLFFGLDESDTSDIMD